MSYTVRHDDDPQGEPYQTRTQAIRGMARAIRALPLTDGERRAFAKWYTLHNYRSAALALYNGRRYVLRVQVQGRRRTFTIDPPAPPPHQHAPQVPATREHATA